MPASASAATITVNSTSDTAADDGACVLREAITSANTNAASGGTGGECTAGQAAPTVDTIDFDIAGTGPHVIVPAPGGLPSITTPMAIDGGLTDPDAIELDGQLAGSGPTGLNLTGSSDGSAIRNLAIYNFGASGITLGADDVEIAGNQIGTDSVATATTLGNDDHGISGGGANTEIRGNVISGNGADGTGHGIDLSFAGDGTTVAGNGIGTNGTGTAAIANAGAGINMFASSNDLDGVTVGGPSPADLNLISGNGGDGITIATGSGVGAVTGMTIEGNRIGTNAAGGAALANANTSIEARGNVSGMQIIDNVVAANTASLGATSAIDLGTTLGQPVGANGVSDTLIAGNRIGTNAAGTAALGAGTSAAVVVAGSVDHPAMGNQIGGTVGVTPGGPCTGDCNVIAAGGSGIEITSDTPGTHVLRNHIGTDAAGTADLGNASAGVRLGGSSGASVGANLISGNDGVGVDVSAASAGNFVQENLIGTAVDGSTPLGNGESGVRLGGTAHDNLIGGTLAAVEGNVIAHNADDGILAIPDAVDNAILGNSIHSNGELGIDLQAPADLGTDGVTPNDGGAANDADAGPNDLQNFPELQAAVVGSSTHVAGSLDTAPSTDYRIEVFSNATPDPSGHGEGQTLLGVFVVSTDASGEAAFAETLAGTAGTGDTVSATATAQGDTGGVLSTSEFAANAIEGCDVTGTAASETVSGTSDDEVICGLGGNDVILPGGGDDVVIGGTGTDEVDLSAAGAAVDLDLATGLGTVGSDTLFVLEVENATGGASDDTLAGDAGDNALDGGAGADDLDGVDGDDDLDGGDAADDLNGGDGVDDLNGDESGDTLIGGTGADILKGEDGGDTLKGRESGDTLKGGAGADTLKGEENADTLIAGDNADNLKGGGGGDDLEGGNGADTLDGEGGGDDCSGGGGSDTLKSC